MSARDRAKITRKQQSIDLITCHDCGRKHRGIQPHTCRDKKATATALSPKQPIRRRSRRSCDSAEVEACSVPTNKDDSCPQELVRDDGFNEVQSDRIDNTEDGNPAECGAEDDNAMDDEVKVISAQTANKPTLIQCPSCGLKHKGIAVHRCPSKTRTEISKRTPASRRTAAQAATSDIGDTAVRGADSPVEELTALLDEQLNIRADQKPAPAVPEQPTSSPQKVGVSRTLGAPPGACSVNGGGVIAEEVDESGSTSDSSDEGDWEYASDPLGRVKDQVKDNTIEQTDENRANINLMTEIREFILREIKGSDEVFNWKLLNSGSHFEKVAIQSIKEVDIMVVASPRGRKYQDSMRAICRIEGVDNTFVRLTTKDGKAPPCIKTARGDFLSPKLFKTHFESLVKKAVEKFKEQRSESDNIKDRLRLHIVVEKKESPALTLSLKHQGNSLSMDLVPALKLHGWPEVAVCQPKWIDSERWEDLRKEVHVVAKVHPSEGAVPEEEATLWRLSFSSTEKKMLLPADGKHSTGKIKTKRKDVLKQMKRVLEDVKEKDDSLEFCSYFIKTAMLHVYDKYAEDDHWCHGKVPVENEGEDVSNEGGEQESGKGGRRKTITVDNRRKMLQHSLDYVIRCIKNKELFSYFVPDVNILKDVSQRELKLLAKIFKEKQRFM